MSRLENISLEQLQEGLDLVDDQKPTLRLSVGICYKLGNSQTDLATGFGVTRQTVHNWLTRLERLESESIEEVVYDDDRSGRPPKLSQSQQEELFATLRQSPEEQEIDAVSWYPALVRKYIEEEYETEYTLRHVRELMNDAGLTWKTARPTFRKGDERARKAYREGFKKTQSK